MKKTITAAEIERFYNKGREQDVPYTYIRNMSPSSIKMIIEILQNR
jgi:hypothetical protein